jgi:hypothetical protein
MIGQTNKYPGLRAGGLPIRCIFPSSSVSTEYAPGPATPRVVTPHVFTPGEPGTRLVHAMGIPDGAKGATQAQSGRDGKT